MKQLARNLRKNMTDTEKHLWRHLRNRQLGGYKFRRQKPIEPYIVDFVCIEKRIIIEVDGGQHAAEKMKDAKRTEFLAREGYRVLRFWNYDVLQQTDAVLSRILAIVSESEAPSPRPSPRGERGIEASDDGLFQVHSLSPGGERVRVRGESLLQFDKK